MDVFDAQGEQRQQHDYSLLLVLGKVEGNWQMPFDCSNIFTNEISHHNCLGNALQGVNQQALQLSYILRLAADAFDRAASTLRRFLALKTKHTYKYSLLKKLHFSLGSCLQTSFTGIAKALFR